MREGSTASSVRAEILPADEPLEAYYRPGSFFFAHREAGVVAVEPARVIRVPPGPEQVLRANALAESALAAFAGASPPEGSDDPSPRALVGDAPPPAPFVVGALPFDGQTPGTLVLPRVAVVRRPGGPTWRLVADLPGAGPPPAADGEDDAPARPPLLPADPSRLEVRAIPTGREYVEAVETAKSWIATGRLQKVVLARMLVARAGAHLDRVALLARLRAADPDAYAFAARGFLGASPELLVARWGRLVASKPVAGTALRRPDPDADGAAVRALLASPKEREEHRLVADAVVAGLASACEGIEADAEPSPLATRRVWHLATEVRGVLRPPAPAALALAARLHPTPAVCGTPRSEAMAAISALERVDRVLYAGLVGWMDANGDGEWAIALRCAEVEGRLALLFAGAGIVADSDPESELAETEAKFRSMLDALGYPNGGA